MFSFNEKRIIAKRVEDIIREINHPEMDNDNIRFQLHIEGRAAWSWADITENRPEQKPANTWNEVSRNVLTTERSQMSKAREAGPWVLEEIREYLQGCTKMLEEYAVTPTEQWSGLLAVRIVRVLEDNKRLRERIIGANEAALSPSATPVAADQPEPFLTPLFVSVEQTAVSNQSAENSKKAAESRAASSIPTVEDFQAGKVTDAETIRIKNRRFVKPGNSWNEESRNVITPQDSKPERG